MKKIEKKIIREIQDIFYPLDVQIMQWKQRIEILENIEATANKYLKIAKSVYRRKLIENDNDKRRTK